jgi:hypothetical protein
VTKEKGACTSILFMILTPEKSRQLRKFARRGGRMTVGATPYIRD